MFGLLHNLYHYVRTKSERKVTFVLLGLDNAGKTTLSNTLRGELDTETAPSFGFNKSSLSEGKYVVDVFDLGGGKNIRKIWKTYLAEVHGLVYVVDAADEVRFPEARDVLMELAEEAAFKGKPVLVLANKQDLPVSAAPARVAEALGLSTLKNSNSWNIMPCCAKAPPPKEAGGAQTADASVRLGLKWLLGQVDSVYTSLDARVQLEAEDARQEALKRKKERDDAAKVARAERQRIRDEEAAAEEGRMEEVTLLGPPPATPGTGPAAETANVLSDERPMLAMLPHMIDSPKPVGSTPVPATLVHVSDFSDLRPRSSADQSQTRRRPSHPPPHHPSVLGPGGGGGAPPSFTSQGIAAGSTPSSAPLAPTTSGIAAERYSLPGNPPRDGSHHGPTRPGTGEGARAEGWPESASVRPVSATRRFGDGEGPPLRHCAVLDVPRPSSPPIAGGGSEGGGRDGMLRHSSSSHKGSFSALGGNRVAPVVGEDSNSPLI